MKLNNFKIAFISVFAAAILIRILLINWTLNYGNNGDLTRYEDWARIAHTYGLAQTYSGTYSKTVVNNEPPGTLYLLSGTYEVYILEGKIIARITHTKPGSLLWVNTFLQHAMMKLPSLITDMLTGLLVYLIVKKVSNKKTALLASGLFLFNPVIFYNSAVWGQTDSVNNFLFMLSLFLALRKKIVLSIIVYSLSLYIKLSLLPIFPFYFIFIFFISGKNIAKILTGIIVSSVLIVVLTLPISSNPFLWLILNMPRLSQGELQNMTIAAFNFWWMILCAPNVGHANIASIYQTFLGVSLNTWGYLLFGIFTLPILLLQFRKSKDLLNPKNLFLALALIEFFAFMVLPKMHDRYMYPIFPLLSIAVSLNKNSAKYFIVLLFLSFFNLSNVIYSWYPIVLDSKSTFYHIFYGNYFGWIISMLTVATGVWFYLEGLGYLRKAN